MSESDTVSLATAMKNLCRLAQYVIIDMQSHGGEDSVER